MSIFEEQLIALKGAISDQNIHNQVRVIVQISSHIEQSKNREQIVQEFLSINLAAAINDVICTQLIILQPAMKLIRYLMADYHFRIYQFLPILKNILRALIFFVQSDEIEKFQLEFFDTIAILDVLMKGFLSTGFISKQDEGMQATFLCLLKFIELVLRHDCVEPAVKNLMVEIYIHLLGINGAFKCISNNFELIMKVANIGDEFLDRFVSEYEKDGGDLWLYKILQILLRIFESYVLNATDVLGVKVFENIFNGYMKFILEQLTSSGSSHTPELFNFCISILNAVLWTPIFSQVFYTKILDRFVKLNGDSMVFCLSKSSTKIRKYTTYTMKIFLTALVSFSSHYLSDKHTILNIFLQSRLCNSIIELKTHEVLRNHKALIILYDCSFLRQKLSIPLNANRVLENLLTIFNHHSHQLDDNELWSILKTFAYCSNYAALSELEYAGVHKTSEILLEQAAKTIIDIQKAHQPIDKYTISLAKDFSTNKDILNSFTFIYLSQQTDLISPKVAHIIPTHNVLPLLVSSDYNQVENAVKVLHRHHLTEDDMNFVIEQCFGSSKLEEAVIGAALNLIGANLRMISNESTCKICSRTIAFLEAKQVTLTLSKQCYLCIVKTCADLIRFKSSAETVDDVV